MVCYTFEEKIVSKSKMLKKGLLSTHAYAILDAKEVNHSGGPERLLKLRNPWGFFAILFFILNIRLGDSSGKETGQTTMKDGLKN